jgi:hypothetical protein
MHTHTLNRHAMPDFADLLRALAGRNNDPALKAHTPCDLVFDDQPIEALLYEAHPPEPSPASLTPAALARLDNGTPP